MPGCGTRRPSGSHWSRRLRQLLLRRAAARRAPRAACPCGTARRTAARPARRARAAASGRRRGTARAASRDSSASSASAPPLEIVTSARAGGERAACHLERLLGVARVRHRERERARSDERRRAVLLQHGDRHRERRGADGLQRRRRRCPSRPCRSMTTWSKSSASGSAGGRNLARGFVRGGELLGHRAQRRRRTRANPTVMATSPTPRTSAGRRRPRPWP